MTCFYKLDGCVNSISEREYVATAADILVRNNCTVDSGSRHLICNIDVEIILECQSQSILSAADGGVLKIHASGVGRNMIDIQTQLEDDCLIVLGCIVGILRHARQ